MEAKPQATPGLDGGRPVWLHCECGSAYDIAIEKPTCRCGAEGIAHIDGVLVNGSEFRSRLMELDRNGRELIAECERGGWRQACERLMPGAGPHTVEQYRTADVIPVRDASPVLDINPRYGENAAQYARSYRLMALTRNALEARFLAARKAQDGLHQLTVALGDLESIRFAPGQFAAIVATPLKLGSRAEGAALLRRLRPLLAKDGYIFVTLRNRYAWRQLRGTKERVRHWSSGYFGYQRLFHEAGLEIASVWMSPVGCDVPYLLIPFQHQAMLYFERRWNYGGRSAWNRAFHCVREVFAMPWLWRLIESDYAFLLRAHCA